MLKIKSFVKRSCSEISKQVKVSQRIAKRESLEKLRRNPPSPVLFCPLTPSQHNSVLQVSASPCGQRPQGPSQTQRHLGDALLRKQKERRKGGL